MSKGWDRKREKRWMTKELKAKQRAQEVDEEMKRWAQTYESTSRIFDDFLECCISVGRRRV